MASPWGLISLKIPRPVRTRLDEHATRLGVTRAALIRVALGQYVLELDREATYERAESNGVATVAS